MPSGPVKTRTVKQKLQFFLFQKVGGYLNDTEGLRYPFTYVGKFYSFSLEEKASSKNFYQALNVAVKKQF